MENFISFLKTGSQTACYLNAELCRYAKYFVEKVFGFCGKTSENPIPDQKVFFIAKKFSIENKK